MFPMPRHGMSVFCLGIIQYTLNDDVLTPCSLTELPQMYAAGSRTPGQIPRHRLFNRPAAMFTFKIGSGIYRNDVGYGLSLVVLPTSTTR